MPNTVLKVIARAYAFARASPINIPAIVFSILAMASLVVLAAFPAPAAQSGEGGIEENRVYLVGPDNALTELPLEQGTPRSTRSPGMLVVGVGKSRTFIEVSGKRASIRLSATQPQTFVIGTSAAFTLPAHLSAGLYALLQHFDVNNKAGTREWLFVSTTGGFVFFKNKGMMKTPLGIPLNFERYGDHAVKIQPRTPLPPGEYGFSVQPLTRDPYAGDQPFYRCFGID